MVFTSFDLDNLKLTSNKDEVVIYYENNNEYKEVVKWISDEWIFDPEIMTSIFEAINLFNTDKIQLLEKLGHEYAVDFIPPIVLDKRAIEMIVHMTNYFYIWFEKENDEEKIKLLNRLIHAYKESNYETPSEFMMANDYYNDAKIIKIVSFVRTITEDPEFIEPTYKDTEPYNEDLYLVSDLTDPEEGFIYDDDIEKALWDYSYMRVEKNLK